MDGVLLDSGVHHRDAWVAACHDCGVTLPPEFWRLTIGRPGEEAAARLMPDGDAAEHRRLADLKREHYVRLARRGLMPIRGAPAFVECLVREEVPRAIATSASRADMDRLLGLLDLRRYFDVAVAAEDVRRGKPDPEVYLAAATALGAAPAACLVFEDAVVGVQAARAAGMRVVGITTAHTADELVAAGAERALADFEEVTWPV
jgi:HAD superfamily hydrolase (TIGR01509 family)